MEKDKSADDEFEPTADMMVNDFDDEQTLEEAEIDETAEEQQAEAHLLQQEQDMPIEKLLAMYGGYRAGQQDGKEAAATRGRQEEDDREEEIGSDQEKAAVVGGDPEPQSERRVATSATTSTHSDPEPHIRPAKRRRSTLSVLYPELARKGGDGGGDRRALRSEEAAGDSEAGSSSSSSSEEVEEAEGGSVDESSWRKTIMIGSVYQASVPAGLQPYTDSMPPVGGDQLLWSAPLTANADELVQSFQQRVAKARQRLSSEDSPAALPCGSHIRDCEHSLFLLLQCNHDAEEAFRRWRAQAEQQKLGCVWPASLMAAWSEDECASFENGLRFYGKDFFTIQQQRVRTRSVGELVQFYYLWKKTERHDVFANRAKLEKRKYALTPGITDYMERFIEEQQRETSVSARGASSSTAPASSCSSLTPGTASLQVLMATPVDQWPETSESQSNSVQWRSALSSNFSADVPTLADNRAVPLVPP